MEMEKEKREKVKSWAGLFAAYNVWNFDRQGGGADISPLQRKFSTPVMELMPDSQQYFDVHHSDNDVFERVHRRELCLGAIAMSQMVYLVSMYGL
jgi:carboxypeptidase Q